LLKLNVTSDKELKTQNTEDFLNVISQQGIQKIDLEWDNLNISAKINKKVVQNGKRKSVKEDKKILDNISGSVRNGKFTAIIGPSGTTTSTLLSVNESLIYVIIRLRKNDVVEFPISKNIRKRS